MQNPRFRILAVEPDPACAESLKRLISDRVNAEVIVAPSAEAAVGALASQIPDIVLISALLPSAGEEQVMWQLKRLDAGAKVPVLTIPPAVELAEPRQDAGGRLGFLFRKRRAAAPIVATYDRGVLGDRIVEALKQSRVVKPERHLHLAKGSADMSLMVLERPTLWEASAHWRSGSDLSVSQLIRPRTRGRRAHRLTPNELPWSSSLIMPNGVEVRLINVSRSGILVESPIKFAPDSPTEFHLKGPEANLVVPARFIRSEVSAVDALGVRYQAAAIFSAKVELFPATQRLTQGGAAPQALAELLVRLTAELNEGGSPDIIRTTFEQGLRQLVPSCDIKLRHTPAGSLDGCDSIYFTVPTSGTEGTVLQATFDPDYEPVLEEFKLLRAAASVAAVVVQYQGSKEQRLEARG
jgi:CheY-like chemotaxis protein